jgi:hypothetical protein
MMTLRDRGIFGTLQQARHEVHGIIIERGRKSYQDVESWAYQSDVAAPHRVTLQGRIIWPKPAITAPGAGNHGFCLL